MSKSGPSPCFESIEGEVVKIVRLASVLKDGKRRPRTYIEIQAEIGRYGCAIARYPKGKRKPYIAATLGDRVLMSGTVAGRFKGALLMVHATVRKTANHAPKGIRIDADLDSKGRIVGRVKSTSRANLDHIILLEPSGVVQCSCESARKDYNFRDPDIRDCAVCKHCQAFRETLIAELEDRFPPSKKVA